MPLKIDLHVHTCHSRDCTTTPEEVVSYSKRRGLSGVAITDHDTVKGALELLKTKNTGIIMIPGIEVSTGRGHILGINVTTQIPSKRSAKETVAMIHEAGGLAVAAHPLGILKASVGLDRNFAFYGFDAVEAVNASVFPFFLLNYFSKRLASCSSLPQTAGSDSHLPESIGLAYTLVESIKPDPDVEDIIQAIKKGLCAPFGQPVPWRLRLRKITRRKR